MRYIKKLTTKYGNDTKFEIVEDTPQQKIVCLCRDEEDSKIVLKAYNLAEKSREYRQKKKLEKDKNKGV